MAGTVEIQRFGVTNQWACMGQEDFKKFMARLQEMNGIDLLSAPKFTANLGVTVYRGMLHTNAIVTGPFRPPPEVDSERKVPRIEWTASLQPDRTDFVSHNGTNFLEGVSIKILALHDEGQWKLKITGCYDEFLGYARFNGRANLVGYEREHRRSSQAPLAAFQSRVSEAEVQCRDGEVVVLRFAKTDVKGFGDRGWFHRGEHFVFHRFLYVFVEPRMLIE